MELIEGKWYICKKDRYDYNYLNFRAGFLYKAISNDALESEIGYTYQSPTTDFLMEHFYSTPFDENTDRTTQYPKVMEVSDFPDFPKPLTRVVFMEKNGRFFVWNNAKTLEEAEKEIVVSRYKFAREVSPIIEVSKKEIAEWKGVKVDQIQIID